MRWRRGILMSMRHVIAKSDHDVSLAYGGSRMPRKHSSRKRGTRCSLHARRRGGNTRKDPPGAGEHKTHAVVLGDSGVSESRAAEIAQKVGAVEENGSVADDGKTAAHATVKARDERLHPDAREEPHPVERESGRS